MPCSLLSFLSHQEGLRDQKHDNLLGPKSSFSREPEGIIFIRDNFSQVWERLLEWLTMAIWRVRRCMCMCSFGKHRELIEQKKVRQFPLFLSFFSFTGLNFLLLFIKMLFIFNFLFSPLPTPALICILTFGAAIFLWLVNRPQPALPHVDLNKQSVGIEVTCQLPLQFVSLHGTQTVIQDLRRGG